MTRLKVSYLIIITLVFGILTSTSSFAESKDKAAESQKPQAEAQKMQNDMAEKWHEYATPGVMHQVLYKLTGDWTYTVTSKQAPDSKPEVSEGTSHIEKIMDGRFIKQTVEGTAMGQPFSGMGIMGFNNKTRQFQSMWIDNMGTGMMTGTGTYDPEMKAIVEDGKFACVQEDGEKSYRAITRIINDNKFTYEWYIDGPKGERFRAVEVVYKRRP